MKWTIVALYVALACISGAAADAVGEYYVIAPVLNERAAPVSGQVVNKIYRGQRLHVYEIQDGWGLVAAPGFDQRWVSMEHLSQEKPAEPTEESSLALKNDPRIDPNAIAMPGQYGLNKKDVDILWRGARQMLESNQCSSIQYGDKSVSQSGVYFVTCEGPRNVFFTESDLQ